MPSKRSTHVYADCINLFAFGVLNPAEVVILVFFVVGQVLHSPGVLRRQRLGLLPEAAQVDVRERGPLHHHADR